MTELAAGLDDGDFTSVELTESLLDRISALDARLNAFITVTADEALAAAARADQARASGKGGALNGLPIIHKDIFCTRGVRTTCGSRMLDNFISPYDATVVEKLADAGAVVLGKSNMDEFAMGSSNETSYFGPVC
ncbi:MAG: amidase, partial [Woeseiaceae bacterium]